MIKNCAMMRTLLPLSCFAILATAISSCAGSGGAKVGGTTGNPPVGSNAYGSRSFSAILRIAGSNQKLTLATDATSGITGAFVASRGPTGISGTYIPATGVFSASGNNGAVPVIVSGTLPIKSVGGTVTVSQAGTDVSGTLGVETVNTLYFSQVDAVTDSYFASNFAWLSGYQEGSGRVSSFTTYAKQPHDPYLSAVLQTSLTDSQPKLFLYYNGGFGTGSKLRVTLPKDLKNSFIPAAGDCSLSFAEGGGRTFYATSGTVVIDYLDIPSSQLIFHLENVALQGQSSLLNYPTGIGHFTVNGFFMASYAESTIFGP